MGSARRGYILIAVLWALALVGTVAAAYAYATRTNVAQVRAEAERAQAYYAARGACIQAVKDLATGVRRAESTLGAVRIARDPNIQVDPQSGGVKVGDLPAFPAEMAGAGGLLGAIANRMNQIQRPEAPNSTPQTDGDSGRSGGAAGYGSRNDDGADEQSSAPLLTLGQGTMHFAGAKVEVWLESETGKLNINAAPRAMLERLFVAMGDDPSMARGLVDQIELYRLSLSAEDSAERTTALRRLPNERLGGRQFRYIEEMINVPGIDPARQERLMGVLTVYGSSAIDPNYASREVLRAVGIVDKQPLDFVLAMQAAGEPVTVEGLRQAMSPSVFDRLRGWLTFGAPPVFTARTRAVVGESSARYLIRVEPGSNASGNSGGGGVTRLLESREDWL
jgi:type II secretory pathway component PulK